MELDAPRAHSASLRVLKVFVAGAFAVLAALLVVILAHGFTSDASLIPPAEVLTVLLAALGAGSLLAGVNWAWRARPQHRKAVVFLVAITLATLLAHAYIVGVPAVAASGTVSGAAGSSFSDGAVSVQTSVVSSSLQLTLEASGGKAIASATVTADGAPLAGGWDHPPSFASPLQPNSSTSGTWQLPASGAQENVSVTYQELTCYDTSTHAYGCIMDEIFYVPEGMGVLAGQHCSSGAGAPSDCHLEHPPLVPALLAAGMAVFGEYNTAGWRAMPALLGTFSIPLLFGIAWMASESKKAAYLSATLLALDVMFFSQSSAGLLDVPEVFFGLAAFFVYFAGAKVWKFDRYVLAGVFLGVAGLAKETAVFIALAFVTYVVFFGEGKRSSRLRSVAKVAITLGLVFAAGLQTYDAALATSQYSNFLDNIHYVLSYGSSLIANQLACQPTTGYWCKFPNQPGGPPILPTDWLLYYSPVAYFLTSVTVNPGAITYVEAGYYGVTNLLETWTVFVWVPLVAYVLYRHVRRGKDAPPAAPVGEPVPPQPPVGSEPPSTAGEIRFAGLALTLFLWNYVPYIFLFLAGRVTYPFYIIPALPAMAMGTAFWVSREWFPKWLMYLYLVMVFGFFLVYFPDKAFLPVWLRALMGH